ncbi:MAG: hypothetical protein JWO03_1318 [Bacteroidetes bacterium]|nr:hypothetical protein [Bacteroidota bacterium]
MNRYLLIIILLAASNLADGQSYDKPFLRTHYQQCFQRRTALDSFVNILENSGHHSPAEESYLGISYALTIQYLDGMWSKYKVLIKAKGLLNSAVERDPNDPEFRFMRFTLEHNIPAFLCMSTHVNDDLKTILSHTSFLDESPDMKSAAIQFILDSKRCSPQQIALLERIHADVKKRMTAQK